RRRLVQHLAQVDQGFPRLVVVLALDLEDAFVAGAVVAPVFEPAAAAGAAAHLPARAAGRLEVLFQEHLVELLDVGVEAPAFAVDDHFHHVGLGGGHVLAGDVRIEHGAQLRAVLVAVEQVERLVGLEPLLGVGHIERDVQGKLGAGGNHAVRRHAAEVDADVRIALAIDDQRGGDIDIGAVEVLEFLLPVLVVEFEEDGADETWVVEFGVAGGNVGVGYMGSGSAGFADFAESLSASLFAEASLTEAAAVLELLAGRGALFGVKPTILVGVELGDEFALLAAGRSEAAFAEALAARSEERRV